NEAAGVVAGLGGFRGDAGTFPSRRMCFQQVDAKLPRRGVDVVDSPAGKSDHASGKIHCRSPMLNKHLQPVERVPNQNDANGQPRLGILESTLFWHAYMRRRRLLL